MMNAYGWGWGILVMAIFWILIIATVVLVLRWLLDQFKPGATTQQREESALDILKKRYARGEIDKAEFEEKKKDLL